MKSWLLDESDKWRPHTPTKNEEPRIPLTWQEIEEAMKEMAGMPYKEGMEVVKKKLGFE